MDASFSQIFILSFLVFILFGPAVLTVSGSCMVKNLRLIVFDKHSGEKLFSVVSSESD